MSAGCIGFLEIFPDCAALGDMCGGLDKAEVSSVVVNRAERTMEIEARFTRAPAPAELSGLEHELCEVFGLANVRIAADYPGVIASLPHIAYFSELTSPFIVLAFPYALGNDRVGDRRFN